MDLEALIWIAVAVLYFLFRGLGRKKRGRPAPGPQRAPERSRPEPQESEELDEALRQIREALGFPQSERPPAPEPDESAQTVERPLPTREIETPAPIEERAPGRRDQGATMEQPRPGIRREEPTRSDGRGIERPLPRAHGDARPVERPLSRPDLGGAKKSRRSSPDERKRLEHRLEPSYKEENVFERIGPHVHARKEEKEERIQLVSPYDAPPTQQLSGLMRRLAKKPTLREAFLLKEVLDRPLAMRRRR